ncbi:hypothetical protein B0T26DRAFT_714730 [Lasiosphaeria miniovina]|uniref:Extracellular membrane protein CFEM domain-containing protein n=1 Tax=Lasiosphaeria miniovina TaxID=1954250 RepID=A0AA40AB72_9PEZI|nr:uncharacterized protein B0T26DRAFT_714730 [Lasiosphaeria miniovina]KAK0712599.1 hypothetical protein B0T26DRAFT_714730 [Lasiosphaeria miniovina]
MHFCTDSLILVAATGFIQAVSANSAATCTTPISALYALHPECARSCLGCVDSNESFSHNCEINGNCCRGSTATTVIPLVYGCVETSCSAADRQASWAEFLRNCANHGNPVSRADTPAGYSYINFDVTTGADTPLSSGSTTGPQVPSTASSSTVGNGAASPTQTTIQTTNSDQRGSSSGLQKGEIIGIALGSVSALCAVVGLGLRWRHLRMEKKRGSAAPKASEPQNSEKAAQ